MNKRQTREHYEKLAQELREEQREEIEAALREAPCNGDRCKWFGTFADGWGAAR